MDLDSMSKVKEITVLAEEPPTLGNINAFYNSGKDMTFYVPDDSVEAYKAATNWSQLNIKPISERPTN